MLRWVTPLLIAVLPSTALAQVAWTRDAGSAYSSLKLSLQRGQILYGSDFQKTPIAPYRQLGVLFYGEAGVISRWLTLSLEGELFRRGELVGQGAVQGLGDLRIGAWTGLLVQPFRLSLGLRVGVPTGDPTPTAGSGDAGAQAVARSLPTGDGEVDAEWTAAAGSSFGGGDTGWPLEHYATASVGYWLRSRGISDAGTYRLELGTKIPLPVLDRVWWIARATGLESFATAGELASAEADLAGVGNGVSYTSIGFEAYVRIAGGLGASVSWDTAVRGRRIVAAAPLRFGLSFEL